MSLRRLYKLREGVPKGATAMVGDWTEADRRWPGASAAWDEMSIESGRELHEIEIFQIGPLLFASPVGSEEYMLYVTADRKWVQLGNVAIKGSGAFVKIAGSNGALYIPRSRTLRLDVVGPTADEIPGFAAPIRLNGKVSAVKGNASAEDLRQAVLAIQSDDPRGTDV